MHNDFIETRPGGEVDQCDQLFRHHIAQASACIAYMLKRFQASEQCSYEGFEVLMFHFGARIDLVVCLPLCEHKRLAVQQALDQPVEFSDECGQSVRRSMFPIPQIGTSAQIAAQHKSALALRSNALADGAVECHSAASSLRFIFSSHVFLHNPDWLAKAQSSEPIRACFMAHADTGEATFMCFTPESERSFNQLTPVLTFH